MSKNEEKTTAVAETKSTEVATFDVDYLYSHAGEGTESVSVTDVATPFIKLAQALSPELDKTSNKYIKGLEAGDFFNTVTKEVYKGDAGFLFIPAYFGKIELEFKPREQGGGLVKIHQADDALRASTTRSADGKKDVLPNGNELIFSAQHYIIIVNPDGSTTQAVMSMKRTQVKVSKILNSSLKGLQINGPRGKVTPPAFMTLFKATAMSEVNGQGQKYFNFNFERQLSGELLDEKFGLIKNPDLLAKAQTMYELAKKGDIDAKLKFEDEDDAPAVNAEGVL